MSLIPFILDLAEELHDINFNRSLGNAAMDIEDIGFGMYPLEQLASQSLHSHHPQLSPSSRRSARLGTPSSVLWVPIKGQQQSQQQQNRHHPYGRVAGAKTVCCNKSLLDLEKELSDKVSSGSPTIGGSSSSTAPASASKSAYSVVNRNGFQVSMNVKQFASDELTVKTIDNCIVVEGQHDEKEDGHGVISRHFIRKYMLPKGFDPNEVHSTLSSDGILTVKAPPPPPPVVRAGDERIERIVDIQQSGGPAQLPKPPADAKDAQTPKSTTNNDAEPQQQQQPSNTPNAATAAAAVAAAVAAAEPNGNDAERNTNGNGNAAADELLKAAILKETESKPVPIVETSNGAVAAAAEQPAESMEVTATAAEDADKEAAKASDISTTTNTTAAAAATAAASAEPTQTEDANANDVSMGSVANNGNGTTVPDSSDQDVDMPAGEPTPNAGKKPDEMPVVMTSDAVSATKGAEELAAADAAILFAKNQAAVVGENGAAAAVEAAVEKAEELAAK